MAEGFSSHKKKCSIETLSAIPVVPSNHNRKIWLLSSEHIKNIRYNYIPMINIPFFKNIGVFLYTFFKVFFWSLFRMGQQKVILCDVLNVSIATASLLASKLTFTKNITIVTDLPGLMVTNNNKSITNFFYSKIASYMLYRFNGYIFLTKQMNPIVNPKNRPFMIMEGLVDVNMGQAKNNLEQKDKHKIIIYAGGLYEKYGIKTLILAFLKLKDPEARLHLYGNGEMVKDMEYYSNKDSRIVYKGMVPNASVVADQLKATLLINPRPTSEEFTKYSFPSKNMEYMVSGTPMVTTKLPGMPDEYLDYVYLIEEESLEGFYEKLKYLLSKPKEELQGYGSNAKDFVMNNKNNVIQTDKILKFLS
ncbi:glycosyltransferase [Maribacter polysiphoniae]|uniref:Glycosyltransferase n=1 Tax=Maribacter polysiphoniae TaxID=429344 RepID=A0ABR7W3C1_9FLAO|nr:glycosyltransferase [Maribacter polysiphoniae]MBD1262681.1 glycosyltransferase [Maribacter polysiphoniae]